MPLTMYSIGIVFSFLSPFSFTTDMVSFTDRIDFSSSNSALMCELMLIPTWIYPNKVLTLRPNTTNPFGLKGIAKKA